MKRHEWTFQYTAKNLAAAAHKKHEEHKGKFGWWTGKKLEVMAKIRESGIEIQDSVAADYSHTKGLQRPEIKIDSGLQRDLTECQEKIRSHASYVDDYAGWIQVLEGNPEARLDLEHDDYLYFFGK